MCLHLLNNASVGAFIGAALGAAGTYVVVRLLDRAKKTGMARSELPALITTARSRASQDVQSMLEDMQEPRMVPLTIGPGFDIGAIDRIYRKAFLHLSERQRLAVPTLLFWMTSANAMRDREQETYRDWREGRLPDAPSMNMFRGDRKLYLNVVIKLSDAYLRNTLNENGFYDSTPSAPSAS